METSQLIAAVVPCRGTEIVWETQSGALMLQTLQNECLTTSMEILPIKKRTRKLKKGSLVTEEDHTEDHTEDHEEDHDGDGADFIATLVSHNSRSSCLILV